MHVSYFLPNSQEFHSEFQTTGFRYLYGNDTVDRLYKIIESSKKFPSVNSRNLK